MEEGNSLLQKMRRVFSENEDQERELTASRSRDE